MSIVELDEPESSDADSNKPKTKLKLAQKRTYLEKLAKEVPISKNVYEKSDKRTMEQRLTYIQELLE